MPTPPLPRVYLAQTAPVVGALARNAEEIVGHLARAHAGGAHIALFPELAICGYPPRDLLDREDFLDACHEAVLEVVAATERTPGLVAICGALWRDGGLRNSAVVAQDGRVVAVRHKALLPAYDVFDEPRWFVPEREPRPVEVGGWRLGVLICEDAWNAPTLVPDRHYPLDPVARLAGCELLLNLSASPFHAGKGQLRRELVALQTRRAGAPMVYVNQVGGQDELVFDGGSLVMDAEGRLLAELPAFEEAGRVVDLAGPPCVPAPALAWAEEVRGAIVLGLRDFARRCGFRTAVLGLSGGIDSAVVACLAVEALGAANVVGVGMPGPYSSPGSVTDAEALARNLGIRWELLPIAPVLEGWRQALAPLFAGTTPGVAEENLQARARGTALMALSNKFGHLVLTTGNKSELAVGYCTLYGDMNGAIAPIADLYKTEVQELARWINRDREIIPQSTLDKPPSAELRPDQRDEDSLPPYAVLDRILRMHLEESLGVEAIVARGEDPSRVREVLRLVRSAEFKRWQAAPGLRLSTRAFGSGRRVPLARVEPCP